MSRVRNTILILNLNHYNSESLNISDLRVKSRTVAWETAEDALGLLTETVASAGEVVGAGSHKTEMRPEVLSIVRAIRQMALASGHWSVWMAVFSRILTKPWAVWVNIDVTARRALIDALFVRYMSSEKTSPMYSVQPDPPTIFPGTDTRRVVLP